MPRSRDISVAHTFLSTHHAPQVILSLYSLSDSPYHSTTHLHTLSQTYNPGIIHAESCQLLCFYNHILAAGTTRGSRREEVGNAGLPSRCVFSWLGVSTVSRRVLQIYQFWCQRSFNVSFPRWTTVSEKIPCSARDHGAGDIAAARLIPKTHIYTHFRGTAGSRRQTRRSNSCPR